MSIQKNFPGFSPSLNLNFARSKRLDPRVTFVRQTGATVTNELGLLERVGNNISRFDHVYDSSTGTVRSLGLLVEESSSNLLTYSEDFSTTWIRNNYNVSTNAITAPDGTLTADKIIPINSNTFHDVYKSPALSSGTYTFSIFAKAAEQSFIRLRIDTSTLSRIAVFNISNGTLITDLNITSSSIIPYPNGWYRCSITITDDITNVVINGFPTSSTGNYSGDGTSGLYIWGAQLEQKAFPTSYIPTTGLPTTRLADNAYIDGENFSSFYNQIEGTVFASFQRNTNGTVRVFNIDDGTNTNRISGLASDVFYQTYVNPAAAGTTATFSETNTYKVASGHQDNNMQVYVNGFYQQSNTSITIPKNLNTFRIGNWHNNTFQGTTISQLVYYPRRLTNDQLQQLTR